MIQKFMDSLRAVSYSATPNRNTGIGTIADSPKNYTLQRSKKLSEREIAAAYLSSGLVQKIIDLIPSLSKLVQIRVNSDVENFDAELINKEFENKKILQKFSEASISARLFRESYLILDIDDDKDYSEAVEINNCNGINDTIFREIGTLKPIYNETKTERIAYEVVSNTKEDSLQKKQIIHKDRVLLFTGKHLTPKLELLNNNTHASILDGIIDSYGTMSYSYNNVSSILSRVLTFVYKMKGLLSLLDLGQENSILTRLRLAKNNIGSLGGILLDLETEEIEPMTVSLAGIPETIRSLKEFFTAQSELTHDQLWNEGSFDTASVLEDKNFQRVIHNFVSNNWVDNFQYFGRLTACKFTSDVEGLSFILELPEANKTLKEELETKYIQAQIDAIYISSGVLSREIVQANRFSSNPYDTNLSLSSNIGIEDFQENTVSDEENESENTNNNTEVTDSRLQIKDTRFMSLQDVQITSESVQTIFESVKEKSPLLFQLLDAEQIEE